MKNLCLWIPIVLLSLQSYVMSVKEDVLGAVGGAVTLHLCYTGAKSITWNFVTKPITIARTKPQESTEIEDIKYFGRLSSTPDGSLIITELRLEDQGIYRAQSLIDKETKTCDYHLTVFSNLTAEDVTINPNVTNNKTCEVSLTCSVDSGIGSNVTIIWRSLNSSNVNQTENVVFVPPSNINFTYICTAKNPASNISKNVVPWLYCNNDTNEYFLTENDISKLKKAIIGIAVVVFLAIFLVLAWSFIKKEKNAVCVNENAGSETPNVKQPIPSSRVKGTAGMSKDHQTIELQESQSNETTDKTLYSSVQHGKEPQESQSNFTNSNTVYSTVQQLKGKDKQKSPSGGPNGNCSNPPLESCYAEVQLPKDKSDQKASLESCYAEVQLPKPTERQIK